MATYQKMDCVNCKYYEAYHKYPNPNSVARHYCKKCHNEIKYIRENYHSDFYVAWLPKGCYFNNYFEYSDEYLQKEKDKLKGYEYGLACQVED